MPNFIINIQLIQMGVKGLWDILLTTAKKIQLQQLRGQTIAIDASLWLVKVNSIFSDIKSVLLSILRKIVLLRQYDIKPVFVFDGIPPALKRNTLQKRRKNIFELNEKQIKKKAQLEVIKLLNQKGSKKKSNEKTKQQQQQQQCSNTTSQKYKIQQIQQQITEIDIIKLQMQSQLLNSQYQLIIEQNPRYRYQLSLEQFSMKPLSQRLELIEYFKYHRYQQTEQQGIYKQQLTCQQRLQRDLHRIIRKSKITQMKHDLYVKLLQKSKQSKSQEYEIVTGEYQNKKFQQKRKLKSKNFNQLQTILQTHKKKQNKQQVPQEQIISNLPVSANQKDDYWDFLKQTNIDQFFDKAIIVKKQQIKQQQDQSDDQALFYQNKINLTIDPENLISIKPVNNIQQIPQLPKFTIKQIKQQEKQFPDYLTNYTAPQIQLNKQYLQLKKLLQIMGLPYLNAPSEAEAQCAYLQMNGLVNGVITQDSDIFLFGGKNVYRGVFQNDIRFYNTKIIQKQVGLNRLKFILFALFLGSDYTEGIKGIGIVNGMEILKVFDNFDKIKRFKTWASKSQQLFFQKQQFYLESTKEQKQFYNFHKNFKKYWYIAQDFPDQNVIQQYLSPKVDQSKQKFIFTKPDTSLLEQIFTKQLNLPEPQIKHYLKILTKQNDKILQPKITDYYSIQDSAFASIQSKRLLKAVKGNNNI